MSESLLPAAALPPLPPSPSALLGDVAEALAGAESLLDAAAEAGGEGGGGAGGGASSTSLAARTDEAIAAVLVVAARAGILQSGGAAASASSAAGPGHDAGVAAVRHADSLAAVRAWVEAQSAIATAYADALDAREAAAAAAPALPGAAVRQSSGSRGPAVESAAVGAGVRQSAKGGGGRATSAGRRRGVSVELAAPAAARASDPQEASITRSRGAAAVQGVRENAPGAGADNVHQATRRPAKRTRETVAGSAATPAQSRPALAARPLSVSERIARVSDPALRELLTDGSLTRVQVATLLQSVEDA